MSIDIDFELDPHALWKFFQDECHTRSIYNEQSLRQQASTLKCKDPKQAWTKLSEIQARLSSTGAEEMATETLKANYLAALEDVPHLATTVTVCRSDSRLFNQTQVLKENLQA